MSSSKLTELLLLFAALLFTAFVPSAWSGDGAGVPTEPVELRLDAEVRVAAEQIVLGDVATIYARSLSDFRALSGLVLSRIPDDSQELRLPASYLEARIRAALPAGTRFAVRAPREVLFRLQRLGVSAAELSGEILRLARAAGKLPAAAEAQVEFLGGLEGLKGLGLDRLRVEPAGQQAEWRGDLSFKVLRSDGEGDPAPRWVRARVRWFEKVWMASAAIPVRERPQAERFREGRVETTALTERPFTGSREELTELLRPAQLRRALAAGAPLARSMLERKPDAVPGSQLRVVFISEGGLRVSADGALVGAGTIGADVKARLKSSRKLVTGRLVSPGQMEVSL